MEDVTLKQFLLDLALMVVVSFIFAATFIYVIPGVMAKMYDTNQNTTQAE